MLRCVVIQNKTKFNIFPFQSESCPITKVKEQTSLCVNSEKRYYSLTRLRTGDVSYKVLPGVARTGCRMLRTAIDLSWQARALGGILSSATISTLRRRDGN